MTTSPKDKVVVIFNKQIGLVLPGECQELKKDIQAIIEEAKRRAAICQHPSKTASVT